MELDLKEPITNLDSGWCISAISFPCKVNCYFNIKIPFDESSNVHLLLSFPQFFTYLVDITEGS